MNSLMSRRIRWSSLSNRKPASALHSSVLPTPVGPRKRNEPVGRFGSERPERERRIALATAAIASSWPTTRSCSFCSISSSLSRSPCISLATGMPVARATTSAISSAPTSVRSSCGRPPSAPFFCSVACASLSLLLELRELAVLQLGDLVVVALALQLLDLRAGAVDLLEQLRRALRGGLLGLPDLVQVGDLALQPVDLLLDQAAAALARPRPSPSAPRRARSAAGSGGGRACRSPPAWSRSRSSPSRRPRRSGRSPCRAGSGR